MLSKRSKLAVWLICGVKGVTNDTGILLAPLTTDGGTVDGVSIDSNSLWSIPYNEIQSCDMVR